jgi:succinyl-diaminopimelate desuccinylase
MQFGKVTNLWARIGTASPLFCFAGHTDVVPPGDAAAWSSPPFEPAERDGLLYGRGAADMKGGLAAMVVAAERFLTAYPRHTGSIAFLITSDEEGPARDGTRKVIERLAARGEKIDFALLGEPSSSVRLGDVIRIGRRGSLSATLKVNGIQGHAAYPQLANNPVHRFAPALLALCERQWDDGNEQFPPTSMQIVNVAAGIGLPNVTPACLLVEFNLRYSTEWDAATLQQEVAALLDAFSLDYELEWHLSGEPFLTGPGDLIDAVVGAVTEATGNAPELSTGGGTSDGRFIAPAGAEVVELGLVNATIHQVNECANIEDVIRLSRIYARILEKLLAA